MSTSKESLTPQNETTSKAESRDAQTLKQASDPRLQEKKPSETGTTSKNDSARPETTNEQQIDDTQANEHDPAADSALTGVQEITSVESDTVPKDSSPFKIAETHEKETGDNKSQREELAEVSKTTKWEKIKNCFRRSRKKPPPESPAKSKEDPGHLSDPNALSNLIQADVEYIKKGARNLGKYSHRLDMVVTQASNEFEDLKGEENAAKKENLDEMRKSMIRLKLQIPPKLQAEKDEKELYKNLELKTQLKRTIPNEVLDIIPQLHNEDVFEGSIEFKDFEARYNNLDLRLKLCLLCFSIFPENAIIRKRLMLQWWVAEGFVDEDDANKRFMELIKKGFIDPVNDNKSLDIGRCKIHPFYRSALITLAERAKFFNFNEKGLPTQNFEGSFQACLVGKGLISYEDLVGKKVSSDDLEKVSTDDLEKASTDDLVGEKVSTDDLVGKKVSTDDLEKVHLLMNVEEQTLDFKDDWFAKMTNVNLLYLGRWGVSPKDHIEVEDTKFLDGFVNMQCMKFLSLQGVSNVISLPESLLKLTNLKILDLRACHNLETLPEDIGLLKSLTHLDMSECYLLTHMPESLSQLRRLKVLKGFIVKSEKGRSSCKLDDLNKLENLIKLSIYTGLPEFPEEKHVQALEKLGKLKKLSITWGGKALRAENEKKEPSENGDGKHGKKGKKGASKNRDKKETKRSLTTTSNGLESTAKLPSKLEKLDLKCFPMLKTPNWLELKNLKDLELKKLYIRGGKFSDLGQYQDWNAEKDTWKVEVLRLKYLSEIEVEWTQLQELFPGLVYLEQVSCPKLTFAPCDANGVWINQTKLKP